MDPSIGSPAEARARALRRWLVAVALASVLLAALLVAASRSPLLSVREIRVEGVSHGSTARIARLSGLSEEDRILWLDRAEIRARILQDPWVADVEIEVDLPWTVILRVRERSVVGTIRVEGRSILVGEDGTILGPGRRRGAAEIVLPAGPASRLGSAPELRAVARALAAMDPATRGRVRRVVVGEAGGLELVLADGARVRYGAPRDVETKARVLAELLAWVESQGIHPREINVVAPSAPAVDGVPAASPAP